MLSIHMKTFSRTLLALTAVMLCGILATESAEARGRSRIGISIGVPLGIGFGYYGYGYPYYPYYPRYYYPGYYPAPLVVERPPVYVEQQPAPQVQQPQAPTGSWYYCHESGAYYPYVQECAGGWQRVAPQPGG
jgi:hypothetical protein